MRAAMMRLRWLHVLLRRWIPQSKRRGKGHQPLTSRTRFGVEILEQSLAPTVSLSVATPTPFPEGDSGTSNMIFMVTRSGDLMPSFSVSFATQDGTDVAGTDYVAESCSLYFAANQTTTTIAVPVIGKTILQNNRTFSVVLAQPTHVWSLSEWLSFPAVQRE